MSQQLRIDGATEIRRLFFGLLTLEGVFVVFDFTFAFWRLYDIKIWRRLCNLAREDSFATWFASSQAFVVAVALLGVGLVQRRTEPQRMWGWGVLAAFFAWISADDALAIHERASGDLKRWVFSDGASWFPSYSWQLMMGPFLVGMVLFMAWFLYKALDPALRPWIAAAVGLLALAVGFDFVEGVDDAFLAIADVVGTTEYAVSHTSKVTEELLEMVGTSVFLCTFLRQLTLDLAALDVRFVR